MCLNSNSIVRVDQLFQTEPYQAIQQYRDLVLAMLDRWCLYTIVLILTNKSNEQKDAYKRQNVSLMSGEANC